MVLLLRCLACFTSVALAKPAKIWRESGLSSQEGRAPRAAAAPRLAATLGSVNNPRYLSEVLCTESASPLGMYVAANAANAEHAAD